VTLGEPDLSDTSRSVALTLRAEAGALHLIFNAYWDGLEFELPPLDAGMDGWRRIIDTNLEAPDDLAATFDAATVVTTRAYGAGGRSVVVLAARSSGRETDGGEPR
jgi:glycogen operon protein